jgi:Zinc carboxypeptidase
MRTRFLVSIFAVYLVVGMVRTGLAASPESLRTPLEVNAQTRISTSAEMTAYLKALSARHPTIANVEVLGKTVQGRAIEALVMKTKTTGAASRPKVMIIGSQHGAAEPAGGEALLVIARELAERELRPLLDDLDVILIPNANPDGRDIKKRANANGVNINTDFVLLSQPESRIVKDMLAKYQPDALLDSHESAVLKRKTLARDGYLTDFDAQFEIGNNPSIPAGVREYALNELLPMLTARVTAGGLPAQRYIGEVISIKQPITNGGLTLRNFRNTAGMSGAVSFLVETKLDSREDTYPTYRNIAVRLERQLLCLRTFLNLVHEKRAEIAQRAAAARDALHKEPLTLFAGYEIDPAHPKVSIPMRRLDTRKLESLEFRDHRKLATGDRIPYPPMLVITKHVDKLRDVLDRHGISSWSLTQPTSAEVIASRFESRPSNPAACLSISHNRMGVMPSYCSTHALPVASSVIRSFRHWCGRTKIFLCIEPIRVQRAASRELADTP